MVTASRTFLVSILLIGFVVSAGTIYNRISSGYDVGIGAWRYRTLTSGVRGYCRADPWRVCDSNTGGGGTLPCVVGGDICEFYIAAWEDSGGNMRTRIDPNGAYVSQSTGGQTITIFGGASGSSIAATNSGWLGLGQATKDNLFGCAASIFLAGDRRAYFGNFADVCASPPSSSAQLTVQNPTTTNNAARIIGATGQSVPVFSVETPFSGHDNNDWVIQHLQVSTTTGSLTPTGAIVTTPNDKAFLIEVRVVARCTTGSTTCTVGQGAAWVWRLGAKTVGSTITIFGDELAATNAGCTAFGVPFACCSGSAAGNCPLYHYAFSEITGLPAKPVSTAGGSNIVAFVQGKAGANITWAITTITQKIGS